MELPALAGAVAVRVVFALVLDYLSLLVPIIQSQLELVGHLTRQ
jgi:hypothetical protein